MTQTDTLKWIQQEVENIGRRSQSDDEDVVKVAIDEDLQLVEFFYSENDMLMAPQQYEAARKDFGYFVALIELALGWYQ